MLTMWISQNSLERRLRLPRGFRFLAPQRHRFRPRLEGLEERTVLSTLTVTNNLDSGAGSLRAAIKNANSGDTIAFASSLNGQTITLTSGELAISQSLDIEGPGASILAISGNNASRVFDISQNQKPVTVTIAGLTIENGLCSGDNGGGGILNISSAVSLNNDLLSNNEAFATSPNQISGGGAIENRNGGTLTVAGCTFTGNEALGSAGGARGLGGAIHNVGPTATVTVTGSTFMGNLAQGGNGGTATDGSPFIGQAFGGGIVNEKGGTLTVLSSTFTGNIAQGGNGGNGGLSGKSFRAVDEGEGGGIWNLGSTLFLSGSTFTDNQALGGSNATAGASGFVGTAWGGGLENEGSATVTNSTFDHNLAQGGSGNTGGSGVALVGAGGGGGINNIMPGGTATLTASNLTLTDNQAVGGAGNSGGVLAGEGIGGGLGSELGTVTAVIANSTIENNQAIGGQGAAGSNDSDGLGGGIGNVLGSTVTVSTCTLSGNSAIGAAGGSGTNGGNGFGGGVYNDGQSSLTILTGTITANQATGGSPGTGGSAGLGEGGGLYLADGGVACLDTFTQAHTTTNHATTDHDDIFGSFMTC
jgi:hypothetical protein